MGVHWFRQMEQAVLLDPEDQRQFADIGQAHLHFTREIHPRITALHPDITFYFLPLWYHDPQTLSSSQMAYLETSAVLPAEIIPVACLYSLESVATFSSVTGRRPLVWDNFYAERGKSPLFPPPFDRDRDMGNDNLNGYIFLPAVPDLADASDVSWSTFMDYAWSPRRYIRAEALRRALLPSLGSTALLPRLEEYVAFVQELQSYRLPPTNSGDRLAWVDRMEEGLAHWRSETGGFLQRFTDAVTAELDRHAGNLVAIRVHESRKPFPLEVRRLPWLTPGELVPESSWEDAAKIDGFLSIQDGKDASERTEAWMLYGESSLFVRVRCHESRLDDLVAQKRTRDDQVYMDDSVELFLDTDQDATGYYHIIVNAIGTVQDIQHYSAPQELDSSGWDGHYQVHTQRGDRYWQVTIEIPFADLGGGVAPGTRWNFNICRGRQIEPKEYSSYALLLQKSFHAPKRFWTLEFQR